MANQNVALLFRKLAKRERFELVRYWAVGDHVILSIDGFTFHGRESATHGTKFRSIGRTQGSDTLVRIFLFLLQNLGKIKANVACDSSKNRFHLWAVDDPGLSTEAPPFVS